MLCHQPHGLSTESCGQDLRHGRPYLGGCHDGEHVLALWLAVLDDSMDTATYRAVVDYESPVPLFSSGSEAADHGQTGINACPGRGGRSRRHASVERVGPLMLIRRGEAQPILVESIEDGHPTRVEDEADVDVSLSQIRACPLEQFDPFERQAPQSLKSGKRLGTPLQVEVGPPDRVVRAVSRQLDAAQATGDRPLLKHSCRDKTLFKRVFYA
ncbi:hypothetical protein AB0B78_39815 [Streptomyces sp. NPDC040724]|uniref:hypothetical protein n=1 Tax=Streptomyces sp. NPDC040724 TaxID=3155612 RepID=UPI0033FC05D7